MRLPASLVAQQVRNLPAMEETWVQFLGQEDPLEKGLATHSSILAYRISWTEEPSGLQSLGLQRVGHDWSDLARQRQTDSQACISTASSKSLSRTGEGKVDLEVQGGGGGKGTYWAYLPTRSEAKFKYSAAVLPALPFLRLEMAPRNPWCFPYGLPGAPMFSPALFVCSQFIGPDTGS